MNSSFWLGFEKQAGHWADIAGAAGLGALGGGEDDGHGGKKNRSVGAIRGVSALAGLDAAHHYAKGIKNPYAYIGAITAGAVGGHALAKHFGPKYKHEVKEQQAIQKVRESQKQRKSEKPSEGASRGGFEKQAGHWTGPVAVGGGLGALLGGEKDREQGGKKNRSVGAIRGLGSLAAMDAVARMAGKAKRSPNAHLGLLVAAAAGGHALTKRLGPKYEHEQREEMAKRQAREYEKMASSMTEIGTGIGHAATALKSRVAPALKRATSAADKAFVSLTNQPGTAAKVQAAKAAKAAKAGVPVVKPKPPQPSFLTKARIYGKGAVAGGALTAAGFGIHGMARSASQGAMQPMQQGYY